jgi:two-component system, OmpR family, response regulator
MKVLTFFPLRSLEARVSTALASRQCVMDMTLSTTECLQKARLNAYEALLLYVDPENYGDILTLVKLFRYEQINAALFVFERNLDLHQRLQLLEAGVDDCVHEPFFPAEFAIRLGMLIRLRQAASNLDISKGRVNVLRVGDLELDLLLRTVTRRGKVIDLRPKEYLLLQYLARNVNRSVTRTMILEHVWNSSFEGLTNVVDVYISSLRSKLDRGFPQKMIQTNRGVGYMLTSGVSGNAGEQTMSERTSRRPGYASGE